METHPLFKTFEVGDYVRHSCNHRIRGRIVCYWWDAHLAFVETEAGFTQAMEASDLILMKRYQSVKSLIEESVEVAKAMDKPLWRRLFPR